MKSKEKEGKDRVSGLVGGSAGSKIKKCFVFKNYVVQ